MITPSVCSEKPLVSPKWRVRLVLPNHRYSAVEHRLAAETISDVILVVAPLWILRDVRLSSGLRTRLIAIFSCSIMTTMAGLAHAILVLRMPGAVEATMGE